MYFYYFLFGDLSIGINYLFLWLIIFSGWKLFVGDGGLELLGLGLVMILY